jgi:hypothetical protein
MFTKSGAVPPCSAEQVVEEQDGAVAKGESQRHADVGDVSAHGQSFNPLIP